MSCVLTDACMLEKIRRHTFYEEHPQIFMNSLKPLETFRVVLRIICFGLTFMMNGSLLAQSTASYDGMYLEASSVNQQTFYYGEPMYLYFNIANQKEVINYYYIPQNRTNVKLILKDRQNNRVIGEGSWSEVSHKRERWQVDPPSEEDAFRPRERLVFQVYLNDDFGSVKMADPEYYNSLADRLRTLPVGKYQLFLEYYLFPSSEVLVSQANFEVLEVPAASQLAFEQYIKTTTYACNAHYFGKNNYSKSDPNSYENFLQRYDNSPYGQYAFVDMVTQIYYQKGVPENVRKEKIKSYCDFFPQISSRGLKMYYAIRLPAMVQHLYPQQARENLDKFLRETLINENSDISEALISSTRASSKIKDLKNYAKASPPR